MPAAVAAPPATPATPTPPKPSAAPPQAPPPLVNVERPPESYLGSIGDELSDLDAADETSKRTADKPRDPVTKQFVKPGDNKAKEPEKPKAEEPETEPEKPAEPEKPVAEEKPSNIRALGKAYDALKKERDEVFRPKLQSLEAKTKEYERTIEQLKTSQPDVKPIQEKMTALEKENAALREVVRFTDYRKSPEFLEKYEKPYNEAWAKAVSEVTQLSMEMEDGTSRKATAADLLALANAPLDQLDDLAAKWFPRSSARVIRHIEKVRDLAESQEKALEEAKKGAGEFETNRVNALKKQDEAFVNAFNGASEEVTKKYPKWFAPDETDPKGNELLKKGFDFADTVFKPNGGPQLTPEQKAGRLAIIRAKAGSYDRLAAKFKATSTELKEALEKLAEYEKSEPSTETAGQPSSGVISGDWQDQINAELKKLDR